MKCPFFIKKTGGYTYGWKCEAYHNGSFVLHTDGNRINYFDSYGKYNKKIRDKYVNEKCLNDCNSCGLYQVQQQNKNH